MNRNVLIAVIIVAIGLTLFGLYRSGKLDSFVGDDGPKPVYSQSGEVVAVADRQLTYRYATFITVDGVQSSVYQQRTVSLGTVPIYRLIQKGEGYTEVLAQQFDLKEGTRIAVYFDSDDEDETEPVKVHILP